eukprot:ANDGO_03360.mRNA.1 Dynein-1-beta heavy chain
MSESSRIVVESDALKQRILTIPKDPEDMVLIQRFVEDNRGAMAQVRTDVRNLQEVVDLSAAYHCELPAEPLKAFFAALECPLALSRSVDTAADIYEEKKSEFIDQLLKDNVELTGDFDSVVVEIDSFVEYTRLEDAAKASEFAAHVRTRLQDLESRSNLYRSRESLFNLHPTDRTLLVDLKKSFGPNDLLWSTAWAFLKVLPDWMDGPFVHLNAPEIDTSLKAWINAAHSASSSFKYRPQMLDLTTDLISKLSDFAVHLPLIKYLRHPGLKARHWKEIEAVIGINIPSDETVALSTILEKHLADSQIEQLRQIADTASREFALERSLDRMQNEWKTVVFSFSDFQMANVRTLTGVSAIMDLLDDHIVRTQSIISSPHVGPFLDRSQRWIVKLVRAQEILEVWMLCQKQYCYLQPVFSSEDIQKQLTAEAKRFSFVDRSFRRIMEDAFRHPNVLSFCSNDNLHKALSDNTQQLDAILAGLQDYLEIKRLSFPRLFFLSNDELLSVLSETKDPRRIQPHLRKCFEGIDAVNFDAGSRITAIHSKAGEQINLLTAVDPREHDNMVERWLRVLELSMQETIRLQIHSCLENRTRAVREEWLLQWPSQMVLLVSQIMWTREIAKCLEFEGRKGLARYVEVQEKQLRLLVELVRSKNALLPREMQTVGSMIVLDVHARDAVSQMIVEKVDSADDWSFLSQMRCYWDSEGAVRSSIRGDVKVRMMHVSLDYAYEYVGNQPRLVITPLTDRCFRTLMGALHVHLGGAPEGPAGTGKTETTKDLAKAIAKHCVVFNCSDGLDYVAMGKFFKGLVGAGSWCCLDEFNRIDPEVLSVVAQQILSIQQAVLGQKDIIVLEGTTLKIDSSCAVFITMNPGYAGRAELPDNLKALFRPVAMMVPDYTLISEISLLSSGFQSAKALSHKMVVLFKLCAEQLSPQTHYDYGMRAVKAVLNAAALFKSNSFDDEESILVRAIHAVNSPKFLEEDVALFNGIVADLFPHRSFEEKDVLLDRALQSAISERTLIPSDYFVAKCKQLVHTLEIRHGVMLVGLPMSGKSSAIRTVERVSVHLKNVPTICATVNPKSVSSHQLFGYLDSVTHEWRDGISSSIFRDLAISKDSSQKWLVFDGPVDSLWVESMNTVLDDNKKLCLVSGETIPMSPTMRILFEVRDLAGASPATVSRCGMVYLEPSQLGWRALAQSFLLRLKVAVVTGRITNTVEEDTVEMLPVQFLSEEEWVRLEVTFLGFCDTVLSSSVDFCHSADPQSSVANALMSSFLHLLDSSWTKGVDYDLLLLRDGLLLANTLVFACLWTFGASLDTMWKGKFEAVFRHSLAKFSPSLPFTFTGPLMDESLFDQCFCPETRRWTSWISYASPWNFVSSDEDVRSVRQVYVPTAVTCASLYLSNLLLSKGHSVLLKGAPSVGKSVIARTLMSKKSNDFVDIPIFLSGKVAPSDVQRRIELRLEKRRHGVYGPPLGKRAVAFVEDLHMPIPDSSGSKPPLELIRQCLDHGGWYDLKSSQFRRIEDMCFLGTFSVSRSKDGIEVSKNADDRLLRHFHSIVVDPVDSDSLTTLFVQAVCHVARRSSLMLLHDIVRSAIDLYGRMSHIFLPTPSRSHYVFGIKDLADVFDGLLHCWPSLTDAKDLASGKPLSRLWLHECARAFSDKLVCDSDLRAYAAAVAEVSKSFPLVLPLETVSIFAAHPTFFITSGPTDSYVECQNTADLYENIHSLLPNMAAATLKVGSSAQGNAYIPFSYSLEHVSRISRILGNVSGHALLVGVGGSGRRTCARLAARLRKFDVTEIVPSTKYSFREWRDDLKRIVSQTGSRSIRSVFLLTDDEVPRSDRAWEDVHLLLAVGEIQDLFADDEWPMLLEPLRQTAPQSHMERLKKMFWQNVRSHLRLVLCLSPSDMHRFREKLRLVPSLLRCCTIDWFHNWPSNALQAVAAQSVPSVLSYARDEVLNSAVVKCCVELHQSVESGVPSQFFLFLSSFAYLLMKGRKKLLFSKERYELGLTRLHDTEEVIQELQNAQELLFPVLEKTRRETLALMTSISAERGRVDETAKQVAIEEGFAAEQAEAQKSIRDECEQDLAKALPALEAALAALRSLDRSKIAEVKAMKNPSEGVRLVMETVCHMFDVPPSKISTDVPGKYIEDFWGPSQKLLSDVHFLDRILSYDKDSISDAIIEKIRPYIKKPEFKPEKVRRASLAAEGLCRWVRAMDTYYRVKKVVAPKQAALQQAESQYSLLLENLQEKQKMLLSLQDDLEMLVSKLQNAEKTKTELEGRLSTATARLERAKKLLVLLGDEKTRWGDSLSAVQRRLDSLVCDSLLCASLISYAGNCSVRQRSILSRTFVSVCARNYLNSSLDCLSSEDDSEDRNENILAPLLGDPLETREWIRQGLPPDSFSNSNAVMSEHSLLWPLFVDPQGQANAWIRSREQANRLMILRHDDESFLRNLENAVVNGVPCLVENFPNFLDASLSDVFSVKLFRHLLYRDQTASGPLNIQIGDHDVEVHPSFRLYLTTRDTNFSLSPEDYSRVCVVNFGVTLDGLQDQLLTILVSKEQPKLSDERNRLLLEQQKNAESLRSVEDKVLDLIGGSSFSNPEALLDDEDLLAALKSSKQSALEIQERVRDAERMAEEMEAARSQYLPSARNASIMFFIVEDLRSVNHLYVFSLQWFITVILRSIQESRNGLAAPQHQSHEEVQKRVLKLQSHMLRLFYRSVSRSLFEKHRLLFSLLIALRLGSCAGSVEPGDMRLLMVGTSSVSSSEEVAETADDPSFVGLDPHTRLVLRKLLMDCSFAKEVITSLHEAKSEWMRFFQSEGDLPETFCPLSPLSCANDFRKLLVYRMFRPESMMLQIRRFVISSLGEEFLENFAFTLPEVYSEMSHVTPLLLVMAPGVDPVGKLFKFAEQLGFARKFKSISLGQGQGPVAAALLRDCAKKGEWLLLQNCHLAQSWLPQLSSIVESFDGTKISPEFRLWLTTSQSAPMPIAILQMSLKATIESPVGVESSLVRAALAEPGFIEEAHPLLRRLLYGYVALHSIALERARFGSIGWNVPYMFAESDLSISLRQSLLLTAMMSEAESLGTMNSASTTSTVRKINDSDRAELPFRALRYLAGEINYGGRITDEWDRRLMQTLCDTYLCQAVVAEDSHVLMSSGSTAVLRVPSQEIVNLEQCIDGLRKTAAFGSSPAFSPAELLGLHSNADISKARMDVSSFFDSFGLIMSAKSSSKGVVDSDGSQTSIVCQTAMDILSKLPTQLPSFKQLDSTVDCRNTSLIQEVFRYNRLLETIRSSLSSLVRALNGEEVLTDVLSQTEKDIFVGRVPRTWANSSFPSSRHLGSYISDLIRRVGFIQRWLTSGAPAVFWMPGLFSPHSFISSLLQNHARKHRIPIDRLVLDMEVLTADLPSSPAVEGCYVYGFFLEGARWNSAENELSESNNKELFDELPTLLLIPRESFRQSPQMYIAPVYRNILRRGVMSTAGYSTNFVMSMRFPVRTKPVSHWIRRSVAVLMDPSA